MSQDEITVMDGSKCIFQLRGVRPFLSDKFDITKHKNYKLLEDFNKKNAFDIEEYIKLVTEYVMRLRPDITIERFASQSPADMLIAPRWGLKNHELTNLIVNHMVSHGYKQGDKYQTR